eukprot:2961312-Prymnesium_polylepis.1
MASAHSAGSRSGALPGRAFASHLGEQADDDDDAPSLFVAEHSDLLHNYRTLEECMALHVERCLRHHHRMALH